MTNFERKLPSESNDEAEILRGILTVQAAFAKAQQRPLGRGTHTKGICARATFEVFDLTHTIGDPAVAARLAHGIFAKPGVYNATVRFANAASTIYPDKNPDLRALSFSVELPPGLAPGVNYQDFSLQSAPTFPINDAHTFAVLMSVLSAGSNLQQLKVILSLPFGDFCRFAKGAFLGNMQQHGKTRAYQQMRYWSTVPFSNGLAESAMFSAIPNPENPARALDGGPNQLQDELIRRLNEDAFMSSFDFGVQLLDADRMTHWGMHKDPSFWVENATAEWKETQAPFHRVGRLTLVAQSELRREECEPRYIDVTEHATPDTKPLGSVNRARHAVELASRQVRLGEATAASILAGLPQAPRVRHPLFNGLVKIFALCVLLALLLSPPLHFVAGRVYAHMAAKNLPAMQRVDQVVYLNQGWSDADRQTYYYTPQGTSMHGVRYSWFVHLERPFVRTRLADPDHMRSLNFIVDPPTNANPDALPVGFAKRYDEQFHDNVVDITCAACHTGQLHFTQNGKTTAIRIDGGEAMTAFTDVKAGSFQAELVSSIFETLLNPFKFNRFASRVLGPKSWNLIDRFVLWRNLASVSGELAKVSVGSSAIWRYPVQEGYGRTDALGRIANVVFGDHISRANFHTGNAPVSYPYLWNIWKFNWEQYNASVSQPMARNVGEAMGVGATMKFRDGFGHPIPEPERYNTTISFNNLYHIESTLQNLKPPRWPEDILGKINEASALRGQQLFQAYCVKCHGPHVASEVLKASTSPLRTASDPMWTIEGVNVNYIGTDPTAANNFVANSVDLTPTGITLDEAKAVLKVELEQEKDREAALIPALEQKIASCKSAACDAATLNEMTYELGYAQKNQLTEQGIANLLDPIRMQKVNGGFALSILDGKIRQQYYAAHNISAAQQAVLNGFDTLDTPQVAAAYKPRPLEGVWATPPFLHNGSVPNLYELLSPVSERQKRFFVGRLDFEPIVVGYATQPVDGSSDGFWMDTSIPGNENTGHEFSASYQAGGKSPAGVIGPELDARSAHGSHRVSEVPSG